ncbi:MAG: CRTAC1 family protein [Acidobacteriota bacterium]|nr:MAG: CRTAC1 family protein [Acidobacteriota bacterium]
MAPMAPKRRLSATLCVLLLLSATAWFGWSCSRERSLSPVPTSLEAMTDLIFDQIDYLESRKDVVCWSSFCKLDNFMARKPHSPTAVLVKIHAMQILADQIWEKASLEAQGTHVTPEDLARVVQKGDFHDLPPFPIQGMEGKFEEIGFSDFSDYRTTSEHWRILLSVIADAVCGMDLYEERPVLLKPLAEEAAVEISGVVSSLALELLQESSRMAREDRSTHVEGWHVREAFKRTAKQHGLAVPSTLKPTIREGGAAETKQLGERETEFLRTLTQKMIHQKIKSLRRFNAGAVEENVTRFINALSIVPVDERGVDYLVEQLRKFYIDLAADCPGGLIDEKDYERIHRGLPYRLLLNGDVLLTFGPYGWTEGQRGPNPYLKVDLSEFKTITLIERDMDAMRDNALHWQILDEVWQQGKGKPMTPFAAEFISEAVSILATYYLVGARELARAADKSVVTDGDLADLTKMKDHFVPPEVMEPSWGEDRKREKEALLRIYSPPLFTDVTKASGIDFRHESHSKTEDTQLTGDGKPKYSGGGLAVGDVDGDGRMDVYLVSGRDNKLYKNNGDGTFRDITKKAGVADSSEGRAALFADIDNDGDLDLFLANVFGASRLWKNDGDGHFTDVAEGSGIKPPSVPGSAFFFDYDKDGDLDLYVAGYGPWDRGTMPTLGARNGYPNKLFENRGNWKFADVTEKAGVGDVGWGHAAAAFDFDRDGDEDIYVANDFGANVLIKNLGDGTFRDISHEALPFDRGHGMNVSFVDVNADGFMDMYVSNIDLYSSKVKYRFPRSETFSNVTDAILQGIRYTEDNRLYVNVKGEFFVDKINWWFEPGEEGWCWHAGFFDYENDGDFDMYVANGWRKSIHMYRNKFFLLHNGYYYHMSAGSPESFAGTSRSFASFDMDNDGDLDLVVNNYHDKAMVLRNEQKGGNRWLKLRLRGTADNRNGVGAEVVVKAGDLVIKKHVTCGLGFLSQEPEILHFGLGRNGEADEVRVTWPNGTSQVVKGAASNTLVTIAQGT